MQQSISRSALLSEATSGLEEAPTVALLGARQVGKTTLARQVAAAWPGQSTVFDLEVATVREAFVASAGNLIAQQRGLGRHRRGATPPGPIRGAAPGVRRSRTGRPSFCCSGSASWDLIQGISETLAGRILFVDVGGFSLAEVGSEHQDRLWMRGGFPRAWLARVGSGVEAVDAVVHAHVFWSGTSPGWVPRCRRKHWAASGACWHTTTDKLGTPRNWGVPWM